MSTPRPRIRASVVCRHEDRLLTVRAIDPVSNQNYLFLPGGKIEDGESPAAAAARETLEETGYIVTAAAESIVREYRFVWAGQPYDCRTYFFRAVLANPNDPPRVVMDDDYLKGVEWTPIAQIADVFAYHSTILDAVKTLLF